MFQYVPNLFQYSFTAHARVPNVPMFQILENYGRRGARRLEAGEQSSLLRGKKGGRKGGKKEEREGEEKGHGAI